MLVLCQKLHICVNELRDKPATNLHNGSNSANVTIQNINKAQLFGIVPFHDIHYKLMYRSGNLSPNVKLHKVP